MTFKCKPGRVIAATISSLLFSAWAPAAFADAPGAMPKNFRNVASTAASGNALNSFYSVTGRVYLSTDAAGTNSPNIGVDVEKRTSASTVRAAYLLAASTGFTGYVPGDGDVLLNSTTVNFDESTLIANSISSYNIRADVTSIVKPLLDAAPVGNTTMFLSEPNSSQMDGEVLVVVFDDSNEPETSINLLYGAQATGGDQFNILLATPVQASNPAQQLSMSLGISYGFQPSGQFSQIDVNGVRLTTSAGGQDDGEPANGALVTVGGLGDSSSNPSNPNAGDFDGCAEAVAPRCDDELYNLKALLADGTTAVTVNTLNPSNDDNIFFGSIVSRGTAAIVDEGILVTPPMQTRALGQTAVVTAVVQDDRGLPVQGRTVNFSTLGPNTGTPASGLTDSGGAVDFRLRCDSAGTNTVVANFINSEGDSEGSNVATVVCEFVAPPVENCSNGIDDDGDGLIDRADPDCTATGDRFCNGLAATIVGTGSANLLVGTPGADVIVGLGGSDVILGRGGIDTICAGSGNDVVDGGDGADFVLGGSGTDIIRLGRGNDSGDGEGGRDVIDGGSGTDSCTAELKINCP